MSHTGAMEKEDGDTAGAVAAKSPAADLRVTLDRLLGEHAMLAMFATQKGFSGDPDFKQIARALDRNSVELADAIGSVYGEEAGEEFLNGGSKWRDHIRFFVEYTVALAKKDKAGQKKAVDALNGYVAFMTGDTLATASSGSRPPSSPRRATGRATPPGEALLPGGVRRPAD